jgi:hypothetical protein
MENNAVFFTCLRSNMLSLKSSVGGGGGVVAVVAVVVVV